MRNGRRERLACVLMAVIATGLASCARHHYEPGARRYGSLKDDVVAQRPVVRQVAKAPAVPAPMRPEAPPAREEAAPTRAAPAPQPKAPPPAAPAPAPQPAPAPAAEPLPPAEDPALAAQMLSVGRALFEAGQVAEARRRFMAAMNGPLPEVLLALARTYDTYYLSRLPASDAAPDMQRALVLYERALERGATEAAADLERTRAILRIPR